MSQPFIRRFVVFELLFLATELGRVHDFSQVLDLGAVLDVEHLMKNDVFRNMIGDAGGIEKPADEYHVLIKIVTT